MYTLEEFCQKYEKLISLSSMHPAFINNSLDYISFIESNFQLLGADRGKKMYDNLSAKVYAEDRFVVIRQMFFELRRIGKQFEISLDKYPLANYIYLRVLAANFLKSIDFTKFSDYRSNALMRNAGPALEVMSGLISAMEKADDYFEVYEDFKLTLFRFVGNSILSTKDIVGLVPVVLGFEESIRSLNAELSIKEKPPAMDIFGEGLLERDGTLSIMALKNFLEKGPSWVYDLQQSDDPKKEDVAQGLLMLCRAQPYDPVCAFDKDQHTGLKTIISFSREEIVMAQKFCQSVLNIFTPEMFVQTSISNYLDMQIVGGTYNKESLLEEAERNLSLLQSYGIISYDTFQTTLARIRTVLQGG